MLKNKIREAFTIIEVVLVLAIAGLIFLMVFIALPALQRSQRNTAYRNNVAIAASLARDYAANNRGRLPTYTGASPMRVGQNIGEDHPFYSYVQNSNLPENTSVKVLDHGNVGVERDQLHLTVGRLMIMANAEFYENSKSFEGQLGVRKQGAMAVWTILEEGDGMVYCQDV